MQLLHFVWAELGEEALLQAMRHSVAVSWLLKVVMWGFEWQDAWAGCEASVAEAPEGASKQLLAWYWLVEAMLSKSFVEGQSGVQCTICLESSKNKKPCFSAT